MHLRTRSVIVGLLAVAAVTLPLAAAPRDKEKDETGDSHRAFEIIKEQRAETTKAYTEELFALAEECAQFGGGEIGEQILKRIEQLHQLPRSRRKTVGQSGVMAGADSPPPGQALPPSEPEDEGEGEGEGQGAPEAEEQAPPAPAGPIDGAAAPGAQVGLTSGEPAPDGVADDHARDADSATPLTMGSNKAGLIQYAGDHDWFRMNLSAGVDYTFFTMNLAAGMRPVVRVVDPSGVVLAEGAGRVAVPGASIQASDLHYVVVRHASATAATGGYTLGALISIAAGGGDTGGSAGGDAGGELTLEPAMPKRGPTPEETNLAWIRGRIRMVREKYKGTGSTADARALARIETRRQRATEGFVEEQKKLALKCVKRGYPAHAYELLLWTLQFDPENKGLRNKLLRQKPFTEKDGSTRWLSAFELAKAEQGFLHHEEYGWVRPEDLAALKAGKMNFNGQWLPKDKVAELRADWKNHWVYETEHYEIHTNAPLADAVEFGREVEKLYAFFFRVFVDYYALDGKAPDPDLVFGGGMRLGRRLKMNYYRSRESYLQACREDPALASDPLLQQSAGFYDPNTGMAYFYREEYGPNLQTIYHEAAHQIFGETSPARGREPPTWMVEGLAVFLEDPVIRGENGAERLLAGSEPPPGLRPGSPRDINDYMKQGCVREWFHGAQRGENYSTGGAVVHFFLLYNGGKYRRGFIRYVQQAYKNAEPQLPTKLAQLYDYCGVTPQKLQEDWLAFHEDPFKHLFDF